MATKRNGLNYNTFTCNDTVQAKIDELLIYKDKGLTRMMCELIEKDYEQMLKEKRRKK